MVNQPVKTGRGYVLNDPGRLIPGADHVDDLIAFLEPVSYTHLKYSEACRPLLGKKVDGIWGKLIDLTAVFALLAGTATTFSLATPLLSMAFSRVFGIRESNLLTIAILVVICVVYTMAVYLSLIHICHAKYEKQYQGPAEYDV